MPLELGTIQYQKSPGFDPALIPVWQTQSPRETLPIMKFQEEKK